MITIVSKCDRYSWLLPIGLNLGTRLTDYLNYQKFQVLVATCTDNNNEPVGSFPRVTKATHMFPDIITAALCLKS